MVIPNITTTSKKCSRCKLVISIADFFKDKRAKDGLQSSCKVCTMKSVRESNKKAYIKNPRKFIDQTRKWESVNPEKTQVMKKKTRWKMKMDTLKAYGGENPCCKCCGEKEPLFLAIDHIHGGGTQDREINGTGYNFYYYLKRNKYPKGFQILCHNCNIAKRAGVCPHKK